MHNIHLNLEGDHEWPDLSEGDKRLFYPADVLHVARLRGGAEDILAIRVDVTTGECAVCDHKDEIIVVVETTVAEWLAVARALQAADVEAGRPL